MSLSMQTSKVVEHYFEMWNAPDAATRRALIEQVWTPEATSVDPLADVRGWEALNGFVGSLREKYPAHRVARNGPIDQHHDRLRFSWHMVDGAGATVLTGIDCVRLSADGRFAELVGFFDGPPPAA